MIGLKACKKSKNERSSEDKWKSICHDVSDADQSHLIVDGREGYHSLLLTNAIYLSSWKRRMVTLPAPGTEEEKEFEKCYERLLTALAENGLENCNKKE